MTIYIFCILHRDFSVVTFTLTIVANVGTSSISSLTRGTRSRGDPELRSGCGVLRAVSQTVLGWFGHHLGRHYDRSAGCFRWTGTASGIRRAHVPGNVARSLAVALICAANTAVERREASAPEARMSGNIHRRGARPQPPFHSPQGERKGKGAGDGRAFRRSAFPSLIACMIACGVGRDHVVTS
jgi:hypothetical protein